MEHRDGPFFPARVSASVRQYGMHDGQPSQRQQRRRRAPFKETRRAGPINSGQVTTLLPTSIRAGSRSSQADPRAAVQGQTDPGLVPGSSPPYCGLSSWLPSPGRRHDVRDALRSAYETFDSIGAEALAEQARIDLRASGGQARERTVDTTDALTAQEALIARLAGRVPQTRGSPRNCSSAVRPSPITCGKCSSSSESPRVTSLHGSCLCARIRRCRSRLRAQQLAHPGSSQGAPGYPAGYPLAGHDYQPWRMRIKAHAT
jgi:hypothetical protein